MISEYQEFANRELLARSLNESDVHSDICVLVPCIDALAGPCRYNAERGHPNLPQLVRPDIIYRRKMASKNPCWPECTDDRT